LRIKLRIAEDKTENKINLDFPKVLNKSWEIEKREIEKRPIDNILSGVSAWTKDSPKNKLIKALETKIKVTGMAD